MITTCNVARGGGALLGNICPIVNILECAHYA